MKQTFDIWLPQHILERRGPILVLFNPEGKKIQRSSLTLYYMKVPCEKINEFRHNKTPPVYILDLILLHIAGETSGSWLF